VKNANKSPIIEIGQVNFINISIAWLSSILAVAASNNESSEANTKHIAIIEINIRFVGMINIGKNR
jgi:hypothetical protein